MNRFLHGVARAAAEAFELPEPIVEIGSYQVEGQESLIDLRSLFPNREYTGIDMREGPGVDCVADVEQLPQASGSAGTVIAMSTFEHVPHFWRGFDEVHRILRPDGVLLVSCPFYFHIHNHPSDYWRFTPEALHLLLERYPQRIVGYHGPTKRPSSVWALAFREEHATLAPHDCQRYMALLQRYAHEPLHWRKAVLYRLARLVAGKGPFAPYLEQNQWQIELRAEISAVDETLCFEEASERQSAQRRRAA